MLIRISSTLECNKLQQNIYWNRPNNSRKC